MLISLAEYAKLHGKNISSIRRKAETGSLKTAQKIGRNWVVDNEEPYNDLRVKSGKYRGWRKEENPIK